MARSGAVPGYRDLRSDIAGKLKKAALALKQIGVECLPPSPREFYDYLTGETPTGDTTTILDVLGSEYLMVHEVAETSELKRLGIPINSNTVMKFLPKVYEAHFAAMDHELTYALDKEDYAWIRSRIELADSWLKDDLMPKHLIPVCKTLQGRFSAIRRRQRARR